MQKTFEQFEQSKKTCRDIFVKKLQDYGAAWRILRTTSLTDQIFIKANRIRSFEIKKTQKIDESVKSEYIGIINYSICALIQLEKGISNEIDLTNAQTIELYDDYFQKAKKLMEQKNHDYDEAWRLMRISSYTDLILMKLFRIKQIENNQGKTLISEGVDAGYFDIINYAVFALIKISENEK